VVIAFMAQLMIGRFHGHDGLGVLHWNYDRIRGMERGMAGVLYPQPDVRMIYEGMMTKVYDSLSG